MGIIHTELISLQLSGINTKRMGGGFLCIHRLCGRKESLGKQGNASGRLCAEMMSVPSTHQEKVGTHTHLQTLDSICMSAELVAK